jgi:multidrug efflux pump subunit AcrA (membrane-fusion protein)
VERDELLLSVEVSGTLKAERSRLLGPPGVPRVWDYKISFLAEEGTSVEEGDPVVGFDATDLERRLREERQELAQTVERVAKAEIAQRIGRDQVALQLAEAEAKLRKAQLVVEVPEELSKRLELDKARIDLALAEKEIEHLRSRQDSRLRAQAAELDYLRGRRDRVQSRVSVIESSIEAMMVAAPAAGTVIHVSENGEKKKVGDQCWRGAKVVEIPDLTELRAEGLVDEADAGKVRVGQVLRFRLEAHPDSEFSGRVRSIRETVSRRSRRDPTKVVRLDLALDRTDAQRMRPGMRFQGRIELERVPDRVLAPAEAVFRAPDGPVAWRRGWNGAESVPVEIGRRNERWVEVISGLDEGDLIARQRPEPS